MKFTLMRWTGKKFEEVDELDVDSISLDTNMIWLNR